MLIIAVIFTWTLVYINWMRFRDVLYPAFIQALLWAIITTLYLINISFFIPVSWVTWTMIMLCVATFSFGALISTYEHVPFKEKNHTRNLPLNSTSTMLLLIVIVLSPLMLQQALTLMLSGPTENIFTNLRYGLSANAQETGGYGFLSYFIPISFFTVAMFQIIWLNSNERKIRTKWTFLFSLLLGTFYGVLSSGRGILLVLIILVTLIPVVLRRVSPIKAFITFATVTIIMFVTLGRLMGKGGQTGLSLLDNLNATYNNIKVYLLSSIPAFDLLIQNESPYGMGDNTLRTIYAILSSVGYDLSVNQLVQPFVNVPMPTNIYTVFLPYYLDFGIFSIPIFLFIFGLIHGYLYKKATIKNPSALSVFLYSISMYPLFSQYGGDLYFSLLSTWIQYFTYGIIFLYIFNRRNKSISLK